MCVHDTDSRGFCVKNGPHCAFAHGTHDIRPPVYDIKEIQVSRVTSIFRSNIDKISELDKRLNLKMVKIVRH